MPSTVTGGRGVSRVDITALREAASQGRDSVRDFREVIEQMESAVNASESFWEGDAAELYRNVFRREMSEFRQVFESFAAYPNDLTAYADRFENVNTRAVSIAAEVQHAVWAEV